MFPEKFFYAIFNPEFAKRPDLKRQIVFDDVPLAKELVSGLRPRDSEIMWKYYAEGKTLSKLGVPRTRRAALVTGGGGRGDPAGLGI